MVFAIFATATIGAFAFVLWLDKGKRDAQKDGVCDFGGQGRDEWKSN